MHAFGAVHNIAMENHSAEQFQSREAHTHASVSNDFGEPLTMCGPRQVKEEEEEVGQKTE